MSKYYIIIISAASAVFYHSERLTFMVCLDDSCLSHIFLCVKVKIIIKRRVGWTQRQTSHHKTTSRTNLTHHLQSGQSTPLLPALIHVRFSRLAARGEDPEGLKRAAWLSI